MEHCQSPTRRYASLCAIRSIKPSSITTMTIYLVSMTRSVRAALPLRRFLGAALDVVVVEEVAVLIAAVTLADALSLSAFAALVTTLVPSAPSRLSVALSAPVTITCRCALRETTPMPGRAFRWPALRSSTQTLLLSPLLLSLLHQCHTPTPLQLLRLPLLARRRPRRPSVLWPMHMLPLPLLLQTTVVMPSLQPTRTRTPCASTASRRVLSKGGVVLLVHLPCSGRRLPTPWPLSGSSTTSRIFGLSQTIRLRWALRLQLESSPHAQLVLH